MKKEKEMNQVEKERKEVEEQAAKKIMTFCGAFIFASIMYLLMESKIMNVIAEFVPGK